MKRLIQTLILISGLTAAGLVAADTQAGSTNAGTQDISYWFSWGQNNSQYAYPNLCDVPAGVNQVFIAFALEDPNNNLVIQITDPAGLAKFKADVTALHKRGVKVILSSGGAVGPYPWESSLTNQQVAQQYVNFIKTYNLDGIDFDVESGTGARLPAIVALVKQQLPALTISLTVDSEPGASIPADMQTLGKALYSQNTLTYLDLMNYDQNWRQPGCSYEDTNLSNNCYIQNIQGTEKLLESWTNDPAKAKQLLSNGIMMGYADDGKIVTPALSALISSWLKQNGYGAVMTWGLSRDIASTSAGQNLAYTTGMPYEAKQPARNLGEYTLAIIAALEH